MPPNYLKIPGFEYRDVVSDDAKAAAQAWLDSPDTMKAINPAKTKERFFSLGNFALFDDDGKETYEILNWACHSQLSIYGDIKRRCVAFWCHSGEHTEWGTFFSWLVEKSFVSEYVVAKNDKGFAVSADIPAGILHAIAMISRAPRQWPKEHFTRFNDLVAKGIPEEIAFNVTFTLCKGPDTVPFQTNSDHTVWGIPSIIGMKRFLNGDFNISSGELHTYRDTTSQCCSHFLGKYHTSFVEELWKDKAFVTALMDYRKGKVSGEVYRPPNPFAKTNLPVLRGGECTVKEVDDFVLPYCLKEGVFK